MNTMRKCQECKVGLSGRIKGLRSWNMWWLVFVIALTSGSVGRAAILMNDSFEQYATGVRPAVVGDGNANTYLYADMQTGDAVVANGSSPLGRAPNLRVFSFTRSAPATPDSSSWSRDFSAVSSGFLRVSFKIKVGAQAGNFAPQITVRNAAGNDAVHLRFAPNETSGTRPGFSLLRNSTTPAVYDPLVANIIPDNWYEVVMIFNLAAKTFDITIENMDDSSSGQFAERLNVPFRGTPTSLQRFLVARTATSFVYRYDIDDLMAESLTEKPRFRKHGGLVPISEKRGMYAVEDASGTKLILCPIEDMMQGSLTPRSSLLVLNPATGQANQYFPSPRSTPRGDVFSIFVSSSKKVYLGMSNSFAEFDLASRTFTTFIENVGGYTMSMDEGSDGKIYIGLYPGCALKRFDPVTKTVETLADLDPVQQYPTYMAVGADGWVYTGVGTEKANVVAYNIQTHQVLPFLTNDSLRSVGGGLVYKNSLTGDIYEKASPHASVPWMKVVNGVGTEVPGFTPGSILYPGGSLYWTVDRTRFPDGSRVENFSLENRSYDIVQANGSRQTKNFTYQSGGASVDAFVKGDDGMLYGSSGHPAYLWKYDPATSTSSVLGAVRVVGSGSLTHFTKWQGKLISNSYAEGRLYQFDPTQPYVMETTNGTGNPKWLASSLPDIGRPRAIVRIGDKIFSTGWPSYGLTGGGMLIYDMASSTRRLIAASENRLITNQTISTMQAMSNGHIAFGTSARTPGGGIYDPSAFASIGEFDPSLEEVSWYAVPLPTEKEISDIHVENDSLLYGVTLTSQFFVYNMGDSTLEVTQDLSAYGAPSGDRGDTAFVKLADGRLLLFMRKAILLVNSDLSGCTKLADTPGDAANIGVVIGSQLYFSIGSRLWSYLIPPP